MPKPEGARDIYISDEATKFLRDWINWKYRKKKRGKSNQMSDGAKEDALVFTVIKGPISLFGLYNKAEMEFNKVLDTVGFGQRKEGMSRRKITLHSFRRFVKTVISNQVNQDYSEWFLGHSKSPYYIVKEPERREIYTNKCMKYLTFLDYTTLEATGRNIEAKLSEKEKEIQILRQRDQMKDEEMQAMKEQIQMIMSNLGIVDQQNKNKLAKQLYRTGVYETE